MTTDVVMPYRLMPSCGDVLNWIFPKKHWPNGDPMSPEEESRCWVTSCPACGWTTNVYEMGGIRYRAAGTRGKRMRCPGCRTRQSFKLRFEPPSNSDRVEETR